MVPVTNISYYSNLNFFNEIEFVYSLEAICCVCFTKYYLVSKFYCNFSFEIFSIQIF